MIVVETSIVADYGVYQRINVANLLMKWNWINNLGNWIIEFDSDEAEQHTSRQLPDSSPSILSFLFYWLFLGGSRLGKEIQVVNSDFTCWYFTARNLAGIWQTIER